MKKQRELPKELEDDFFFLRSKPFDENQAPLSAAELEKFPYFLFELSFYWNSPIEEYPWENPEKSIPILLNKWEKIREGLERKFSKREKVLKSEMRAGIALFFMLMFWSNSAPVELSNWKEKMDGFYAKPVNGAERLQFIMERPNSYPAFRQLDELFTEQYKQYAKMAAIQKRKQKEAK
ncbi:MULTISPECIES: YpoC family protein [Bacillus]|uniref:YpoC family protein n=1 Tax=Bacillus TaxID=1386 RepID=UPI0022E535C4|nr:hypothetical protein [Bacillus smithii]MED0659746.1 hypothetical protein [Bacillus smithii]MED1420100.1 hypothetical protein [Bacillus smithii]MED1455600.1 hypothetical protein [Bacillus smithii]MED1490325.1 hypothetical protein [Bacillus smithii]